MVVISPGIQWVALHLSYHPLLSFLEYLLKMLLWMCLPLMMLLYWTEGLLLSLAGSLFPLLVFSEVAHLFQILDWTFSPLMVIGVEHAGWLLIGCDLVCVLIHLRRRRMWVQEGEIVNNCHRRRSEERRVGKEGRSRW